MRRAWSRSGERRRGVAELLDAIASALPGSRDPRALRQRFEGALRDLLNAREVELRDGPPMPRPPQNMMSVDVRSGDYILGSIDALFEEGSCAFDEWDQHVIGMARQLAAMVLLVDRAQRGAAGASAPFGRGDGAAPIVGSSPAIRAVRARIERIAATDFTVLIEGESGVGKELVARQIHDLSSRRDGPFVAVNCAAIVETLMHGGGNRAFRGGWGVGFVCAPERTYGDFKTQIPATSRYFSCWSGSNCRRHRPAGTEQEGVGRRVGLPYGWVGLPYGSNPETCPVRALRV